MRSKHSRVSAVGLSTVFLLLVIEAIGSRTASAQYCLFSQPTDSINIPGHTFVSTNITIEARLLLSGGSSVYSNGVFTEQVSGGCAKLLWVASGLTGISGQAYSNVNEQVVTSTTALSTGQWHDIAFVHNGAFERLYLDGTLVMTRDLSGTSFDAPIWNSSASVMTLGAFMQIPSNPDPWHPSFLGLLDWMQVSSSPRYSANSYTVSTTCPTSDSSTLLLYDFNEAPGSTVVHDLGPNHWDGVLGVGDFTGVTSPTFVPEPASLGLLALGAVSLLRRRFRH